MAPVWMSDFHFPPPEPAAIFRGSGIKGTEENDWSVALDGMRRCTPYIPDSIFLDVEGG